MAVVMSQTAWPGPAGQADDGIAVGTGTGTGTGPGVGTGIGAVAGEPAIDGRTARRDRNRIAVLDTVLELFAQGELNPSPETVARRSGLSLRSVYRYVADRDGLIHAAIDRHLEKVGPLYAIDAIGQGPFGDRVEAFVTARLRLYEAVAATARVAALRAPTSEILRQLLADRRHLLRAQLEQQFAAEIAVLSGGPGQPGPRPAAAGATAAGATAAGATAAGATAARPTAACAAAAVIAAADALTQIETMDWFMTRGGYSTEQAHAALVAALTRLLGRPEI